MILHEEFNPVLSVWGFTTLIIILRILKRFYQIQTLFPIITNFLILLVKYIQAQHALSILNIPNTFYTNKYHYLSSLMDILLQIRVPRKGRNVLKTQKNEYILGHLTFFCEHVRRMPVAGRRPFCHLLPLQISPCDKCCYVLPLWHIPPPEASIV